MTAMRRVGERCFLYAEDAENIGILGSGKIDGNAASFPNEGDINRPMLLRFLRCSHVHISDCRIRGTDDNLCLQSSDKKYPVEDVQVTNCEFSSLCAAIRIGLKSIGSIHNVVISNCTMHDVWREGIKIECTEGGNISDIVVSGITMKNVSRPLWLLLNNRFEPEGWGSSLELDHMPPIGTMRNLLFSNLVITDGEEMKNAHYRFQDDIMGSPRFGGIRMDAHKDHPIENVMIKNVMYTAIGGVKKDEIPQVYPKVPDHLTEDVQDDSENYYPDWSRTVFLDCRNIRRLVLSDWMVHQKYPDERPGWILENCEVLKKKFMSGNIYAVSCFIRTIGMVHTIPILHANDLSLENTALQWSDFRKNFQIISSFAITDVKK